MLRCNGFGVGCGFESFYTKPSGQCFLYRYDMLCEIILESSRIVYLYEKPQQVTKREM